MEEILKNFTLDFFGNGKHKISPEKMLDEKDLFLLDVRSKEEVASIPIKMDFFQNIESKNIPVNEIPARINEIPQNKLIAIFCPANIRASMSYLYLSTKGFSKIKILEGGYSALTDIIKPGNILKIKEKNRNDLL